MPIDDLPKGAVVVRGGNKAAAQILRRARKDRNRLGLFGISAAAGWTPTTTVADVVEASNIPHDVVQVSTVGKLRGAGFGIERTFKWPHCTIDLGESPTEHTAARLAALFDPPIPKPGIGEKK